MGLLSSVILILFSTVDRLRSQLSVCNTVASQLVSHNFSGLAVVITKESPEKPLGCGSISSCLKIHINHFTILIHSSPKVMLFAIDLHEDFIDEKGIAVSTMISLQPSSVYSTEFYTLKANRFTADGDDSLSE